MEDFHFLALTIKDGSRSSCPPSAHSPYSAAKPKFRSCLVVGRLGPDLAEASAFAEAMADTSSRSQSLGAGAIAQATAAGAGTSIFGLRRPFSSLLTLGGSPDET